MYMDEFLKQIEALKIVPVVVLEDVKDAIPLGQALMNGGLPAAEVTFRTEAAADCIKAMSEAFLRRGVRLVSGGTDNHLMLLNLTGTDLTGKELERLLDEARITVNKNTVPFETRSPFVTSGVRIGTPAVTSRGMKEAEMVRIADLISDVIERREAALPEVAREVSALCQAFPLYRDDIC